MKKLKILILISILFTLGSCEKLLEVNPRQSIDSEGALSSPEAVEAAVNGVYARLREVSLYGRDLIALPDVLSDNTYNTGAGNRLVRESNNEAGYHISNWRYSYYAINQINLILEALDNLDAEESFKNKIKGQSLFLRALIYHNLARVYAYDPTAIIPSQDHGAVPIISKGVRQVSDIQLSDRASIEQVYALIYSDLSEAYTLLADQGNSRAPFFATQGAVAALFSRVALYNGDYDRVISEAGHAIASGTASFPGKDQLVASWRSEKHPESFFEIPFSSADNLGSNESLRATFMTRTTIESTTPASHGNIVVSDDLYELYDTEDLRLNFFQKGLSANKDRYEVNKYASKNGVPNLDNIPVIRMAEVILNLAEAHARKENWDLANIELNKIRTRAGLPEATLQGQELLDEILLQRRLEFAFEGHRFFDLKRLGLPIIKDTGNVPFEDFRILSRIPVREIDIVDELEQNFGYD